MKKFLLPIILMSVISIGAMEKNNATVNLKQFYCDTCKQYLKTKEEISLKFHLENTHAMCITCQQQFESAQEVRQHFILKHLAFTMIKRHSNQ